MPTSVTIALMILDSPGKSSLGLTGSLEQLMPRTSAPMASNGARIFAKRMYMEKLVVSVGLPFSAEHAKPGALRGQWQLPDAASYELFPGTLMHRSEIECFQVLEVFPGTF